jgi:hypothetical protein
LPPDHCATALYEGEPGLDIHVNVFKLWTEGECASPDLRADLLKALIDGLQIFSVDYPAMGEHGGMRL